MPFIQRKVSPIYVSHSNDNKKLNESHILSDDDSELLTVNNYTLSNAIRQLASLALHADDIFRELRETLIEINTRSNNLKERVNNLEIITNKLDAKSVTVPESDLNIEFRRNDHFISKQETATGLFNANTRPKALKHLYDSIACSKNITSNSTELTSPSSSSSRKHNIKLPDIETGKPAALKNLRPWKSSEVLGETIAPLDSSSAPPIVIRRDGNDHQLPSPEEQISVVARHFPGQLIAVNVSGRNFIRQQSYRRSMSHVMDNTKRTERQRKKRTKRRNTIACSTDMELIRQAADGESEAGGSVDEIKRAESQRALGQHSVLWHLKQWGLHRLSRHKFQRKTTTTITDNEKRSRSASPPVRLRSNKEQRHSKKEERQSSSGNWSGSSSIRTSGESHVPPSSSSVSSIGNDSALSSIRINKISEILSFDTESNICFNDGETSSVYSCDTEGYYTSFHIDSGLKMVSSRPKEEPIIECETIITRAVENEYELFGKGSTSTTTSSAGTICTTLMSPRTPSPMELLPLPPPPPPPPQDDTFKRKLRIHNALTAVRVPSMCVVTPPPSDDEIKQNKFSTIPTNSNENDNSIDNNLQDESKIYEELEASLIKELEESAYDTDNNKIEDEYVVIAEINKSFNDAEYVSLNELPTDKITSTFDSVLQNNNNNNNNNNYSLEKKGARVTLDSEGRVVYSSDSLKRKPKASNTTFEPGEYVKRIDQDIIRRSRNDNNNKSLPTVKASSGPVKQISTNPVGAYVDLKEAEELSFQMHENKIIEQNKIKRNESYRLAAKSSPVLSIKQQQVQQQTVLKSVPEKVTMPNQVVNPNSLGSRFYGAKIMIDQRKISPIRKVKSEKGHFLNDSNKVTIPSDTQRARILKNSNDTEIW